jgi:hypothetical protein
MALREEIIAKFFQTEHPSVLLKSMMREIVQSDIRMHEGKRASWVWTDVVERVFGFFTGQPVERKVPEVVSPEAHTNLRARLLTKYFDGREDLEVFVEMYLMDDLQQASAERWQPFFRGNLDLVAQMWKSYAAKPVPTKKDSHQKEKDQEA